MSTDAIAAIAELAIYVRGKEPWKYYNEPTGSLIYKLRLDNLLVQVSRTVHNWCTDLGYPGLGWIHVACSGGETPVEAVRNLLKDKKAVALLSAYDAFPALDLPQDGWEFWWKGDVWIRVSGIELPQRSSCGVVRDSAGYYHTAGNWIRASAPPGYKS